MYEDGIKKICPSGSASKLVMPNDPWDRFFYSILTLMIDSYDTLAKTLNILFVVTLRTLLFLGLLGTFLKPYGILKFILDFLKNFYTFSIQKHFIQKVCLPYDLKRFGGVTRNKTFLTFGLTFR